MRRTGLLCASVALNLVLVGLLVLQDGATPVPRISHGSAGRSVALSATAGRGAIPPRVYGLPAPLGVSNVRGAAGAALAEFEFQWRRRQADLERQFEAGLITADQEERLLGVHDIEADKAVAAALGEEGFREWQKQTLLSDLEIAGIPLSPDESERMFELRRDLQDQRRSLEEAQREGRIDGASLDGQVAALEAAYQARASQVLGDRTAQLEESTDGVGHEVRARLAGSAVSPEQFGRLEDIERARRKLAEDVAHQRGSTEDAGARDASVQVAADQMTLRVLNNEH